MKMMILRLHQFLHDGLERSSNWPDISCREINERSSVRFSCQPGTKEFAVSNTRGQTLDIAVFPTPGSTDQHRVVLRAAAEDLNDAIDFTIASNQGIELRILRGLCQVAGKFR